MTRLSERIARQDDISGHAPPVGSVVAYFPGYFGAAANGGGFNLVGPGSNDVSGANTYLPDNWRVCDGSAPNDPDSPIWNTAGRYLPDLSDSRFIRGSTSSGVAGSTNSRTLSTPQLPSHNHPLTIASDAAPHAHTGSSGAVNAPHSHTASSGIDNAPHAHPASTGAVNAPHNHPASTSVGTDNAPHNHTGGTNNNPSFVYTGQGGIAAFAPGGAGSFVALNASNAPHNHPASTTVGTDNAPHSHPVTVNTNNAPHNHPVTVNSGDAPHSHPVTVDLANAPHSHAGSSVGATGAGDSFDIQPQYLSVFYIMRIK